MWHFDYVVNGEQTKRENKHQMRQNLALVLFTEWWPDQIISAFLC
jgi:hypothetical protein